MISHVEVYVLCETRSKEFALAFLDFFTPNRESTSEDYPLPQYADAPAHIFTESTDLLAALERDAAQEYSLYWDNNDGDNISQSMLFYTCDGNLIVGISAPEEAAARWLQQMSSFSGGQYGYVSYDAPPPESKSEFMDKCKASLGLRLIEGIVTASSACP